MLFQNVYNVLYLAMDNRFQCNIDREFSLHLQLNVFLILCSVHYIEMQMKQFVFVFVLEIWITLWQSSIFDGCCWTRIRNARGFKILLWTTIFDRQISWNGMHSFNPTQLLTTYVSILSQKLTDKSINF